MTQTIFAPISIGELLDKITILEIKYSKVTDSAKKLNIETELDMLSIIMMKLTLTEDVAVLKDQLLQVNRELWDIEDSKRAHEQQQLFDSAFVQLARDVYLKNDIRAMLKKQINIITHSGIVEEKLYSK